MSPPCSHTPLATVKWEVMAGEEVEARERKEERNLRSLQHEHMGLWWPQFYVGHADALRT